LKYAGRGVTTVEERDLWHMPIVLLAIAGLMATVGIPQSRGDGVETEFRIQKSEVRM
jgi:hypothetical protein